MATAPRPLGLKPTTNSPSDHGGESSFRPGRGSYFFPSNWRLAPTEEAWKDFVSAFREDVVVMTQACDLEHRKVENVVLCPHVSLSTFRSTWQDWLIARKQNPSEKAWKRTCEDIADGYVWNQAFLDRCDLPGLATEIRVVDFHDVFTVPRSFLEALLQRRQAPRLRLLPPYREHLAQGFARFFMRVGLPQPIAPSW
ncbi:MAG: hypothetical protein HYS14_07360 [Candidatus Rokubacteria bacterium]|nr:hypothetical protein [Candidatus Rokubacteria bacterium]